MASKLDGRRVASMTETAQARTPALTPGGGVPINLVEAASGRTATILVVDDEPGIAGSLRAQLAAQSKRSLIGQSLPWRRTMEIVMQASPSQATVLLLGESGTGKELLARAIHDRSPRSGGPFVPVNCAALPETILEAE